MAKKNVKKNPKKSKQDIVQGKLNTAANILNHPALRPGFERDIVAGNGGIPAVQLDEKLTAVTVYQAFCNTNEENLGSATTDSGTAKTTALNHHLSTGHSTTVLESSSDN